jgi:hypothetical protein
MKLNFSILFAFCSTFLFGQTPSPNITHQNFYAIRYLNQLSFNPKWYWANEAEIRYFMENNRLNNLIMHTHLHHRITSTLDIALGLSYSLQNPQFPDAVSTLTVPEIRPFQEITNNQVLGKRVSLSHRLRFEERFVSKNDGNVILDGYNFNYRVRYRPQLNINLSKTDSKTPVNLRIADEIMLNFGGEILYNHFDQNRVIVSFEKTLSKNFSLDFNYSHWFQQRSSGKDFFDRNVFRFSVLHRIKL